MSHFNSNRTIHTTGGTYIVKRGRLVYRAHVTSKVPKGLSEATRLRPDRRRRPLSNANQVGNPEVAGSNGSSVEVCYPNALGSNGPTVDKREPGHFNASGMVTLLPENPAPASNYDDYTENIPDNGRRKKSLFNMLPKKLFSAFNRQTKHIPKLFAKDVHRDVLPIGDLCSDLEVTNIRCQGLFSVLGDE